MSEKSDLRGGYARLHSDLQQVDSYIRKVTEDAYRDAYLISNQALSRNPFTSKLLHNFHFRLPVHIVGTRELMWKLFKYYSKSSLYVLNHIATWLSVQMLFRPAFECAKNPVIIDNFLLVGPTLANQCYEEKYFPGLQEVLSKRGRNVYIFPCFYGRVSLLLGGVKLFRIIRSATANFITEYDLLKVADFLNIFKFVCFYPIAVIHLARSMDKSSYLGQLLSADLLETLDRVTAHSYIRYLAGKRLAGQFDGKITLISWFENQVQQKNFYRGIRDATHNSLIYGCRPYIDYPSLLNSFVVETEGFSGVIPDKILVNGSAYMKHSDSLEYRLGVSFRYKYLFDSTNIRNLSDNTTRCLLFLSYLSERNSELVTLCSASVLGQEHLKVRAHPASTHGSRPALPINWSYDASDRGEIFHDVAIIITSESGVAVEAAALGVSVIIVGSQSSFTCNPMFDRGRGVIWDLVFDSEELNGVYGRLMDQRTNNVEEIKQISEWYKSSCFVEPTEENIVRAFDLD